MKILIVVLVILAVVVAVVLIGGSLVPREHRASRAARFAKTPAELFAVISDFANHPTWRGDVKTVEVLQSPDGKTLVRETGGFRPMTLEVMESSPGKRLVTRITNEDLPFGGTWTFELAPDGAGSRLKITEDGFVKPPAFRFLARFVFGYASTMESYLRALGKKFGEEVKPEAA